MQVLNDLETTLESIDFGGGHVFQQTLDTLPYIVQDAISKELLPNILFALAAVLFCTLLLMGNWKASLIVLSTIMVTLINVGGMLIKIQIVFSFLTSFYIIEHYNCNSVFPCF